MIFSHWRLNHFYSFLLDHGSRAANKHFPLGRSVKNKSPASLPASTVRIASSGHTQLFAASRPRLTPAQLQQGGGHQPLFAGSFSPLCPKPFFQKAGACCAEMPQDDAFRADVPKSFWALALPIMQLEGKTVHFGNAGPPQPLLLCSLARSRGL